MAGKNWQAGSKDIFPARFLLCAAGLVAQGGPAVAAPDGLAPVSYFGSLDPNVLWEVLIGGIVVCAFLVAVSLWIHSALRNAKRSQARRDAFVRDDERPFHADTRAFALHDGERVVAEMDMRQIEDESHGRRWGQIRVRPC